MVTHVRKRIVEIFESYLEKVQKIANEVCSDPLKSEDQIAETLMRLINIKDEKVTAIIPTSAEKLREKEERKMANKRKHIEFYVNHCSYECLKRNSDDDLIIYLKPLKSPEYSYVETLMESKCSYNKWKEKVIHWNLVNRAGTNFERARFFANRFSESKFKVDQQIYVVFKKKIFGQLGYR